MFLSATAFSLLGLGQISTTADSLKLATRIVELINLNDTATLKTLALPEFFDKMPLAQFPIVVGQLHSMGILSAPTLQDDLGEQRRYKVTISKDGKPVRDIAMVLGSASANSFYMLGMQGIKEGRSTADKLVKTKKSESKLDAEVYEAVRQYVSDRPISGLSLGVIVGNRSYEYNFGEEKPGVATSSRTIYEIGSITKTMTGYLLAKAVNERRVKPDQDIRRYLNGNFTNLQFQSQALTLRTIATHTSGLPANPPGIPDDAGAEGYSSYSKEKLLTDLKSVKLTIEPGSTFGYSNMAAGVAGLILENVFGETYDSLLNKHIFRPVRMDSSWLASHRNGDVYYAEPHDASGKKTDRWIVNGIESAGGVKSNLSDMIKYAKFNLNSKNSVLDTVRTQLSRETKPTMGWFWPIDSSKLGGTYYSHEGGTGGFTSHILLFPERKLGVVVLMNTGSQNTAPLAYEVALRYLWRCQPARR